MSIGCQSERFPTHVVLCLGDLWIISFSDKVFIKKKIIIGKKIRKNLEKAVFIIMQINRVSQFQPKLNAQHLWFNKFYAN